MFEKIIKKPLFIEKTKGFKSLLKIFVDSEHSYQ